ncbi:MAG: hypothetical protein WA672_17725 [Candidatus Angelobacter sp.]
MSTPLDSLNAKIFREHLHSQFKIHGNNSGPLMLELVDVVENDLSPKMELFSLHFRGPFRPRLNQQTHPLEHEKLGQFEIMLTAISADQENGTMYEAVFHRFRKP